MALRFLAENPEYWTVALKYLTGSQEYWTVALMFLTGIPAYWTVALMFLRDHVNKKQVPNFGHFRIFRAC